MTDSNIDEKDMLEMNQNFSGLPFREGSNISSHFDGGEDSKHSSQNQTQKYYSAQASPQHPSEASPRHQDQSRTTQHYSPAASDQQHSQAVPIMHPTEAEYLKLFRELKARDARDGRQWPGRSKLCHRIRQLEEDPVIKNQLPKS